MEESTIVIVHSERSNFAGIDFSSDQEKGGGEVPLGMRRKTNFVFNKILLRSREIVNNFYYSIACVRIPRVVEKRGGSFVGDGDENFSFAVKTYLQSHRRVNNCHDFIALCFRISRVLVFPLSLPGASDRENGGSTATDEDEIFLFHGENIFTVSSKS